MHAAHAEFQQLVAGVSADDMGGQSADVKCQRSQLPRVAYTKTQT